MPLFICLNILISYLVQTHHRFETILVSVWSEYVGIALILIGFILVLMKKLPVSIRYDFFAAGVILVWICTWPPHFNEDSPVIFFYPLFFCLMTVLVNVFCIQQAAKIDKLTLGYLKKFTQQLFFHPGVIMVVVLVSLVWVDNYLLFPNLLALLILRFALDGILEQTHIE